MNNKLFTLFLLALTLSASAQNYKLFNAGTKKVFTEYPVTDSSYSIAFDSAAVSGSDSIYFPYTGIEDQFMEVSNCMFWGGPMCRQQNKPTWPGLKIISESDGRYLFFNNPGDTLFFDFALLPGASSLFFEDDQQRFMLLAEDADTMNILGIIDSVRYFRILHTDLQGNPINSLLNNELIILGKQLGLARFFRIDLFPQVLQPLTILGNSSPETGLVRLTHEMIYDHQPGDEIQYREWFDNFGGPPAVNYQRFTKYVFLERSNSPDTITYRVKRSVFEMGSDVMLTDTILLQYRRGVVLAEIPYDYIDQNNRMEYRVLDMADYCGLSMWTYTTKPEYLMYCAEDNCWGVYDTQGPPPVGETRVVAGLGLYLDVSTVISPPPYGYSSGKEVVYFKKNGISCGQEVIVGVENQPLIDHSVAIFPNPAGDFLYIRNEHDNSGTIGIFNSNGQLKISAIIENQLTELDLTNLSPGIYLVKVIGAKQLRSFKLIKE